MILAVDVDYHPDGTACVAGVGFNLWQQEQESNSFLHTVQKVADYQPGQFYKRELPCILELLEVIEERPSLIVVDGYVWLDTQGRAGLGAYLYDHLKREVPVIGVAKTSFQKSPHAWEVLRGQSRKPLFITAAGLDPLSAAECVRRMHGSHRIPTLLKRADHLCRGRV